MSKQFSDFSQLKSLKKELEKTDPSAQPQQNQPRRSRTVQIKSKEEEHARNEGYVKGQAVRMMDTNDEAVITGFRKDCFELTFKDGLVVTATKGEFILIDKEEDSMMYKSMPSSSKKKDDDQKKTLSPDGPQIIDLHFERIPGNEGVPEWAALEFQLDYFKRVLRSNLKHRGKKIVFVHGNGEGTLRDAVRKELDETFAISCSYQYGTSDNYGSGTVIVTIK